MFTITYTWGPELLLVSVCMQPNLEYVQNIGWLSNHGT